MRKRKKEERESERKALNLRVGKGFLIRKYLSRIAITSINRERRDRRLRHGDTHRAIVIAPFQRIARARANVTRDDFTDLPQAGRKFPTARRADLVPSRGTYTTRS